MMKPGGVAQGVGYRGVPYQHGDSACAQPPDPAGLRCATKTSETYRCGCAWFADDTILGLWCPCPYHAALGLAYPPELSQEA